jgi:uncharacterized damage-inducible protein DinB
VSNPCRAFAAELEQESAATRRLLKRVPADKLSWRPHPKSMSLGQLAHHVAVIPGRMANLARGEGFDISTANFEAPEAKDAAELLPALEEGLASARELLLGLDDASAAASWTMKHGERTVFSIPRVAMIRTMMLNHWYHHRGQLAVYLRILDVPVPATYGRSADENLFGAAPA